MTNKEKILKFAENNGGYITTKEIVTKKINTSFISRLVKENKLERISTGFYSLPNAFSDDYYKIISKSKKAVFSYATALFLHDLSDRTPIYFDITVPRGYGGPLQNISAIYLHYVDKNLLSLGMEVIKSPFGMDIKCYDIERTICDIIKDRKHMDKEIYTKALKWYAEKKEKNIIKLIKYAKKMNIEKEVVEIMQVIL